MSTSVAELWKSLGLAQNEVKIYETLLEEGDSTVSQVVEKTKIHRRNAYDSLKRLLEKGLVFETLKNRDRLYHAVDPRKLEEILEEKRRTLSLLMPKLLDMHVGKPAAEEVFIYHGMEAYKNEMRDIFNVGQDVYVLGGKALWVSDELGGFVETFIREANKRKIQFHFLWDYEVGDKHKPISEPLNAKSKTLPKRFSSPSTIDIYGDRTVMFSKGNVTSLHDDVTLTVIINEKISASLKTWFKLIWELL